MLVREYRIPFPANLENYRIGMLFMIARGTEEENNRTKGKKFIEVVKDEPYYDHVRGVHGIYTEKVCHVRRFLPYFIKVFVPETKSVLIEKSWTAFPHHCLTIYESPFLGDSFHLSIESLYVENDGGKLENAFDLDEEELENRDVVLLNIGGNEDVRMIAETDARNGNYNRSNGSIPDEAGEWIDRNENNIMCSYKLCRFEVSTKGLPGKQIERWGHRHGLQYAFMRFNRRMYCLMDNWFGLKLSDVEYLSEDVKESLEVKGSQRGFVPIIEAAATSIATELTAESSAGLAFSISDETNPFFT